MCRALQWDTQLLLKLIMQVCMYLYLKTYTEKVYYYISKVIFKFFKRLHNKIDINLFLDDIINKFCVYLFAL